MADKKLVLHPANPWGILQDPPLLLDQLRGLGLLGASFPHLGDLHYRAGPRFSELVSFHVPAEGLAAVVAACHVTLLETMPEPAFLAGSKVQPPACPRCGAKLTNWTTQLSAWQAKKREYRWPCGGCGRNLPVDALDWQRTAGIARYALELWGISAGEAEPSPELQQFLETTTGERWQYFYYQF